MGTLARRRLWPAHSRSIAAELEPTGLFASATVRLTEMGKQYLRELDHRAAARERRRSGFRQQSRGGS